MIPKAAVRIVDMLLRDLTGVERPFGGKLIVFGGDFRQVLPVIPHASAEQVIAETLLFSNVWREGHFRIFSLATNMRSKNAGALSNDYQNWLLRLGAHLSG